MRTNIYIRQEDEDLWARVKDKPSFIHDALQASAMSKDGTFPYTTIQKGTLVTAKEKVVAPQPHQATKLCVHHMIPGACGRASCKRGHQ